MKPMILPALALIILCASCERARDWFDRVPLPPGVDSSQYFSKDTLCEITDQTSTYIDEEPRSQMFGFRKVINSTTGRVDSLITATGGSYEVDSFFYEFIYTDSNVVQAHVLNKTYNRSNGEHIWGFDNANIGDVFIRLNAQGYVESLGGELSMTQHFNYQNGRLVSIEDMTVPEPYKFTNFTYDENGNLTKIMRGDAANNYSETFEYDLSHSASVQIYSASVHPFEILGWLPPMLKNYRIKHKKGTHITLQDQSILDDYTTMRFSNHVVNNLGVLQSFDAHIDEINLDATIHNTTECIIERNPRLPF